MTTPFDITRIEIMPVQLPLIEPFVIAYGVYTHTSSVLLRVRLRNGSEGWGESTPDEEVTGETIKSVVDDLRSLLAPALLGKDARRIDAAVTTMQELRSASPAAIAALDIALHDAVGRTHGLPVWALLGGRAAGPLTISRVVSIDEPEAMAATALRHVESGFRTIKLKVGREPDRDAQRILTVREAVGSGIHLKIDVNQGWHSPHIAIAAIEASLAAQADYYEQPVERTNLEGLAEVRRVTGAPIMADEACLGPVDMLRVVQLDAADLVNIKLMKCGGLRNAVAMDAIARTAGIGTQVGTMVESSIASAAGLQLAAALSNVRSVEMGGPLMHASDIGDAASWYSGDQIALPDLPGLGITIDEQKIQKHRTDHFVLD